MICLLHESPLIDKDERKAMDDNESKVAHQGRDPALKLMRKSGSISLQNWGSELLNEMQVVCDVLDDQNSTKKYSQALQFLQTTIDDASLTPSARVLQGMQDNQECFFEYASRISKQHEKLLRDNALSEKEMVLFHNYVRQSVKAQEKIEASDTQTFEKYLENYFSDNL